MKQWIEDVIVYPTVILGSLSLLTDLCVIVSIRKHQKSMVARYGPNIQLSHDYMIAKLILWLSVINTLYTTLVIIGYGVDWKEVNFPCILVGFIGQFAFVLTSLWHILIASYLFRLLVLDIRKKDSTVETSFSASHKTSIIRKYYYPSMIFNYIALTMIMLALIAAIAPLFINDKVNYTILYNYTSNGVNYDPECWLEGDLQLIAYGLLMASVLFDVIVFSLAVCKYYQTRSFFFFN